MEVCCFHSCQVTITRMEPRVTQRTQFSKEGRVNPTTLSNQSSLRRRSRPVSRVSLSTASHLLQHRSSISHCSPLHPDRHQHHLWSQRDPCPRVLLKHSPPLQKYPSRVPPSTSPSRPSSSSSSTTTHAKSAHSPSRTTLLMLTHTLP